MISNGKIKVKTLIAKKARSKAAVNLIWGRSKERKSGNKEFHFS